MQASIPTTMPGADAILAAVRAVPRGQVSSYGAIARRAGLPRHARWVAQVLAASDDPQLPWHRIVRADGRIAFAPGSAAFETQCARLQAEGVQIRNGKACPVRVHDQSQAWLDEVLGQGQALRARKNLSPES